MSVEALQSFQRRYPERLVEVDGDTWALRRTHGIGPALVMLPGAQGNADMFYKTVLALGERIDIVVATPPPTSDSGRIAAQLAGLLDILALPSASLLGSSLGGYLAQRFALLHPQRIETLFIANTFCDASIFQASMPSPAEFAKVPAETLLQSVRSKTAAAPEPEPAHAHLKAATLALVGSAQSAEALKARLLAVLESTPVPALALAPERIVMIDDDNDPVILPEMRAAMRARYVGAEHHAIAGGGHYPAVLRPEVYVDIIARRLLGDAQAGR